MAIEIGRSVFGKSEEGEVEINIGAVVVRWSQE
jgi:hypothetical protein